MGDHYELPRGDILGGWKLDFCITVHTTSTASEGEREWPSKFNFREMRKVSAWEKYRHVNEVIEGSREERS